MQNPYEDGDSGEVATDNSAQVNDNDRAGNDKSYESGQTAVIPKEVCPGMKPGDTIPMKVVRVNEGDYECEYVKDNGKSNDEPGTAGAEPAPDENSMSAMMA